MKFILIGDTNNAEIHKLADCMEAEGLALHTYMAYQPDNTQSAVLPDETLFTVEKEGTYVLKSEFNGKKRFTTRQAVKDADIIIITPGQLDEIAKLIPDEDFKLVLVMERDNENLPKSEQTPLDAELLAIFNTFTESVGSNTHSSSIYQYNPESMERNDFARYMSITKRKHENMLSIIWKLIEMGNLTFAGNVDVNGCPVDHDGGYVIQYNMDNSCEHVPVDIFAETVLNSDEGLATAIRAWLPCNMTIGYDEQTEVQE